MKLPWKRCVTITLNDIDLLNMIKGLLSLYTTNWTYTTTLQKLTINLKIKDKQTIRARVYNWLKGRV